ncbi:MAG: MOSC domain-containing protein [Candidatus Eremiobacteraeota bacterium]|nr:MOSC domain-containing protein [Candidatus Eremiobacteraeota bacterium]
MQAQIALRVVAGYGIEGDRYATGLGHWSYAPRFTSHITFIETETIERVAASSGAPFSASESRRNVVTRDVRLLELIGRSFAIGSAVFEGERSCEPCTYLDGLLGKAVRRHLAVDGGGLRARVVASGELRVGAAIDVGHAAGAGLRLSDTVL